MGFGGGAQFERGSYDAGAASAARILGKSPSGSVSYPATAAPRPANGPYVREAARPATSAPPPSADAYAAGEAAAKKLLFGTDAIKAEIDSDLRQRYADQQARRAQN
jgi:hypothetical protein